MVLAPLRGARLMAAPARGAALVAWAAELAQFLLVSESRRLGHVAGVARRAARLVPAVAPEDRGLLLAAAWAHDIGYSPEIALTGFHQIDGARHLAVLGAPERLCGLVAHHSGAVYEAVERGLETELTAEFPPEHSPVADALWYADATTGPEGTLLGLAERAAEIRARLGADHPASRALFRADVALVAAARRTERRLVVAATG